jgi:outer membrane receptor protein involved in Fe transport
MLLGVGCVGCLAQAQARPDLADLTLEQLLEVRVEAPAKQDQPLQEAPGIGSTVDRDEIERYGWDSLNDVLFRQPGFAPSQDYERVTVSARGMFESWNNNRLLVLVDGVPFNNVTNGIAYTTEISPLAMLRSIEIIRGPGSALYGTNATNGVVALHTRSADRDAAEARLRLGNAGTIIYDLVGSQRFRWFDAIIAFNDRRTDGNEYESYDASGRTDPDGALARFRVNDEQHSSYLFGKLEGERALMGLELQLHLQTWQFETAQGWLYMVPDERERLETRRILTSLRYQQPPLLEERLRLDYVLQWQRHDNDYRVKYYPDDFVAGVVHPDGNVEIANYYANSVFARAQASLTIWRDLRLLAGAENTTLVFAPDKRHESNVDLNSGGTYEPFPDGQFHPLDDVYEPVVNRPINSIAGFAQLQTGNLFDRTVAATVGLRYDLQFFRFKDLADPAETVRSKSFSQWSPRAALVVFPSETLSLKALAERAFRAPAPTEQFASNTYLGTTSAEKIRPEQTTTYTVAADLALLGRVNLRADWFYEKAADQVAFSSTNNYSANLYTRTLTGVEAEAVIAVPLDDEHRLSGFANYSFVHLLDEEVKEPTIVASDKLTWGPRQVANVGAALTRRELEASVQGHYQGRVLRRPSDISIYRADSVAAWFTIDARFAYRVNEGLRLGIVGTNLIDRRGFLAKTGNYPFDFQIEGLRVLATLELDFPTTDD